MISHKFDYRAPRGMDEAVRLLADQGADCAVVGGGTWLIPNMTFAVHQPKLVLDPKHLHLASITEADHEILVGARATYADVLRSPVIVACLPLLATMAAGITGGVSITAQGTLGGSACYANPSSDVPACLVALRARLRLQSVSQTRDVEAADFFQGRFRTSRRADEMLTAIVIPKMSKTARCGYEKLKFSTGSWPIITAAAVIDEGHARVVLGAATDVPLLTEVVSPMELRPDGWKRLAASCAEISPEAELSDELAGLGYRRKVAASIVLRALERCGASS